MPESIVPAEATAAPPRDRFLWAVWGLAVLPPLTFLLLTLFWIGNDPPGEEFMGMLQGDQPAYTVFARATWLRGNGMVFAQPFDSDPDAPRVLVNLGYSALGLLMRATGERLVLSWEVWRLLFGTLCFGFFGLLAHHLVPGRWRWWALLLGYFGGGAAWLWAVQVKGAGVADTWQEAFAFAEEGYGWWCLNLFRQGIYPLELFYHACFLGALLLYAKRRLGWVLPVVALLWSSHVITAALLTTVLGGALLWEAIVEPEERHCNLLTLAGLAAISGAAAVYYLLYLPSFPSLKAWIDQTRSLHAPMRPHYYLPAYGALLLAPLLLLWRPVRRGLLRDRGGKLLVLWLVAGVLWTHHDVVLEKPVQPIHFARGHVYAALVLLGAKGLALAPLRGRVLLGTRVFLALALAVAVADNAQFVARMGTIPPERGKLTLGPEALAVLEYYEELPGSVVFQCSDTGLGQHIMTRTAHRAYISDTYLTPDLMARARSLQERYMKGDVAGLRALGIDELVIIAAEFHELPQWTADPEQMRLRYHNSGYLIGRLATLKELNPPGS